MIEKSNNLSLVIPCYNEQDNLPLLFKKLLEIQAKFNEIILVGFDNNFKNSGQSDKAIKSKNIDEDHFDKNYFSKGVVWQLPNYKALDYNFNFVNDYFNRENDLNIINCTVGGNLNMFKRNDLKKQLSESKYQNKT